MEDRAMSAVAEKITAELLHERWWPCEVPGIGLLRTGSCLVHVTLSWDSRSPYEVQFRFHTGRRKWIDWIISRELVALALVEQVEHLVEPFDEDQRLASEGDVRFEWAAEALLMHLCSPSGYARILFEPASIAGFLRETYLHVELGAEQIEVPEPAFFDT